MALRFIKEIQGTRDSDNYATPKVLYAELNREFNFDFDPCPLSNEFDGLECDWKGNIFCNPPYSNVQPFFVKGLKELGKGNANIIVYLIPVRSDTKYWHEIILKHADEIRFIKGRLNFNESKSPAPFPTCLVILNKWGLGGLKIKSQTNNKWRNAKKNIEENLSNIKEGVEDKK